MHIENTKVTMETVPGPGMNLECNSCIWIVYSEDDARIKKTL